MAFFLLLPLNHWFVVLVFALVFALEYDEGAIGSDLMHKIQMYYSYVEANNL